MGFLMPPHPLTNFEIQKYYQNEPRFNKVFSRDNLMNMQMLVHIGLLYFVKEVKLFISIVLVLNMLLKKLKNSSDIKANIFQVKANNSIMCGYFCNGLINWLLQWIHHDSKLTDFTSMFSPYYFEKNDSIVLSCFKNEWN